ncbi:iron-containing alcohol dehydrogenase [Swaminathania salitolerans]|uniref:Alcohol dehydrogenase 2 n=1 Tax=Swaminathania salitolerans TaxID=182838 RepID=A0A511BU55_9PROT|nr:iron-containing alcohol dehydrogenase [Swaminathania salitolerans]GBQ13384.1 alcohol dehydrogenase [Swaminathania salitolerans LMG 21291]GEL03303.1 alcohol dehydrogenase [Swaminathania salitolerans]
MTFNAFEFRTVASIEMAWEGASRLGERLVALFGHRRVLMITDAGLVKTGLVGPVEESLKRAGLDVVLFDSVTADPPEEVVLACVKQGREAGAGIVLGLGGGSSLDVAKVAAICLGSDQPLEEMYGVDRVRGTRLPLVLVPTTAGTGSEVTNVAVITRDGTTKMGVVATQLYADHVLLDAALTLGLPPLHTAATGIDAMVHAIEAYTGKIRKNPLSDRLALSALPMLGANLVKACRVPSDRAAREAMLLGAMLAGQAFANSPVGLVHGMAYPLGGFFHVPHGLSNALMLGPVLRFNAVVAAPLYAELALAMGVSQGGTQAQQAEAFISFMETLMEESGLPRRLRDVGVTEDAIGKLAADAITHQRVLVNNPRSVTEEEMRSLYRQAF